MRAAHAAGRENLYGKVDYHFAAEGHLVVSLLPPEDVFAEGIREMVEEIREIVDESV